MNVTEASVLRKTEREGKPCCEVKVRTDRPDSPELLVYFGPSRDNDFDLLAIVRKDAETVIDWFDNGLHNAYADVTIELFETSTMKTDWGRRETFKEQVLSQPGIRAGLGRLLGVSAEERR
ncbi:hypothetical protein [Paenibacillus humicola]|uniref:hypothetical protein n=1 Tax=Paenibacillus humicola TaxID=3110540 RepID=UPI00237A5E7C|nr:hypothetical protein [Paenibacillus humicola]